MRVTPDKPYKLVYSLSLDTDLGAIIEPFVVQVNENNHFTLSFQRVYSNTLKSFPDHSEKDVEIIQIMDNYSHEAVARKFSKKAQRPSDFFKKEFNEDLFEKAIGPYVENYLNKALELLKNHGELYFFGQKTGNPTERKLTFADEPSTVLFHFIKQERNTRYYPTIKYKNHLIKLTKEDSHLVCNEPCWLLVNDTVYYFSHKLNGKKLKPFLKRWYIEIPRRNEPAYYQKFIRSLIEEYDVVAEGFRIIRAESRPKPELILTRDLAGNPAFKLNYKYGKYGFSHFDKKRIHAELQKENGEYRFFKFSRDLQNEKNFFHLLKTLGLTEKLGNYLYPEEQELVNGGKKKIKNSDFYEQVEWLQFHQEYLESHGFNVSQEDSSTIFSISEPRVEMNIEENNDWFDIHAFVVFGEFKIPFIKLRSHILNNQKEFKLPNGELALIPDEWFARYKEIFNFSETDDQSDLKLKKHHYNLLDSLQEEEKGLNIELIKGLHKNGNDQVDKYRQIVLPESLNSELRKYQKEGFSWMQFLKENKFGGCLADDMGLGKTIQTLAFLMKQKEEIIQKAEKDELTDAGQMDLFSNYKKPQYNLPKIKSRKPDLIIMPASLIHNWEDEALKFTPNLQILNYAGNFRSDLLIDFEHYDIILTTYGLVRNDIQELSQLEFNYVILDESQAIKNPGSKVAKAVKQLKAKHKLVLTGTPIENSLTDLWSQMSFLNPGLLGSFKFFKREYVLPIENKADEAKRNKLKALIKPFILRRTKEEVAKDLPSLTEKIQYCDMAPRQKKLYDKVKEYYRNEILENIEQFGFNKSQFLILKGLSQLRMISNHPLLTEKEWEEESGKFGEIKRKLDSVIEENHKILLFSQFVRHLNLFKDYFDSIGMKYAYLTGKTRDRKAVIQQFKNDPERKVFLISLKAGGVGLNLVQADYVFIADPWWNPSAEAQAINRAHRIGQNKSVISYKFISKDSIEEKILKLQSKKAKLAKDIVQANQSFQQMLSEEDLESLLS